MKIVRDFKDSKIISVNENAQNTEIKFDFLISKKIERFKIGVFLNLNEFFVNQHIREKYNGLPEVVTSFKVENFDGFYKVRMELSFGSKPENRHSQMLRDYLYLWILGVENEHLENEITRLNIVNYISKLTRLDDFDVIDNEQVNRIVKRPILNKLGLDQQTAKFFKDNQNNPKKVIKAYVSARAEFYNFMFNKTLVGITPFSNFTGFFDSLYERIFAGYAFVGLDTSTISLNAFYKEKRESEEQLFLFSVISDSYLIKNVTYKCLQNALSNFYESEFGENFNSDVEIVSLEHTSYFVKTKYLCERQHLFWTYFNQYVQHHFDNIINEYRKYLISKVKNMDILDLLFIGNYSDLSDTTFEGVLDKMNDNLNEISVNDIVTSLKFK